MQYRNLNTQKLPTRLRELLPSSLHDVCIESDYLRGSTLFTQRKRPTHMWYVCQGEVVLQRAGAQGENLILQRVTHGFVAEASLQTSSYHCNAVVTATGSLISIPIQHIRNALQTDPAFAMRWIEMLNQEVKRLRAQSERLCLKGVAPRVRHLIETEGREGCLSLQGNLKSLAAELGVSHEALYRTLSTMEKEGGLARSNNHLILLGM